MVIKVHTACEMKRYIIYGTSRANVKLELPFLLLHVKRKLNLYDILP